MTDIVVNDMLNESFSEPFDISEGWTYDDGKFTYGGNISVSGNATLKFSVKITEAGNYTNFVSVSSLGLEDVSAESNVTAVKPIPTHISIENITCHPRDDINISVNVTADDGVPFNGVISVTLPDNSTVHVGVVNGSGVVPWTVPDDFKEGDYPVNASFEGNNKYLPSNGTGVVTVEKVPTHISVGNVTASPGDNVTIPVTVTADDNLPFNGNITVVLPDGSRQTVEIINGSGNIYWTIPDGYDGNYSDVFTFEGNDYYLPSNATGIITVLLIDVQLNITVDKSLVYYGDIVEFTITVRNNGPGNATEVTVVNIIPKEFVYISDSFGDVNYQNTEDVLRASSTIQSYDPSTGVWYI